MERNNAINIKQNNGIPRELIGDWTCQGREYRFNYTGDYYLIIRDTYSIISNQKLNYQNEVFERTSGPSDLIGTWRTYYNRTDWLEKECLKSEIRIISTIVKQRGII